MHICTRWLRVQSTTVVSYLPSLIALLCCVCRCGRRPVGKEEGKKKGLKKAINAVTTTLCTFYLPHTSQVLIYCDAFSRDLILSVFHLLRTL